MTKIIFSVDEMLPKLGQCYSLVNNKNSMPILDNVMLSTKEDGSGGYCVVLTTSDNENWLSFKCNLIECDACFKSCVNANDLYKALSNLKGEMIEMLFDDETKSVTCKYANGMFALPIYDVDSFPTSESVENTLKQAQSKIMPAQRLLNLLNKASIAVANDELRPTLNGVHFYLSKSGLECVSTDGHKLAKCKDTTIKDETDSDIPLYFTLPKKPTSLLANTLSNQVSDIKVIFDDKVVVVNNVNFKLTSRLIEGRYPNYDAVIPKDCTFSVAIDKRSLLNALKRVLPMSNGSSNLISIKLTNGKFTLEAVDLDFSKSAKESIPCAYNGEDFVVGFKGSSLIELVNNIDCEQVTIKLIDPSRAGVFVPSEEEENIEYVSLLMPMRID